VCELGPTARRVSHVSSVRHASSSVDVYRARLIPFWFNVCALISDGTVTVGASMWSFGFNRLVAALSDAGFRVELHRTWVHRGLGFGGVAPTAK
jgi:hypothetical protein